MEKNPKLLILILFTMLLPNISSSSEILGEHPLLSDEFTFTLGGFFSDHKGKYKYNGPLNNGREIDFQNDLGISNDKVLPRGTFKWRMSNSSQLQFEYFSFSDSGSANFTGRFGEGFFSGAIDSEERLDIYRLFYGYNFFKEADYELGVGIGTHIARTKASLEGSATVGGIPLPSFKEELDEWGLLPNLGAYGSYAFSDKVLLSARADWLSLSVSGIDGTLWNASTTLQYQMHRNFGLGLAYNYINVEMSEDENQPGGWDGQLKFTGPSVFVNFNF